MNAPAPFAVESLSVITYQQRPVVTTELLAKLYGTETDNIRHNFARNEDRFVDGTHFIKLEGESLRDFKKSLHDFGSCSEIPRQTRNLTLWTERGAARHAKMLDTDQAWEVFEKLEDCYFAVKKVMYEAKPYTVNSGDKLTKDEADTLRRMMKEGVEKLPKEKWAGASIAGWSKLKSHFGVPYREIPRSEFCEAVSLVARHVAEYQALAAPAAAAPIGDAIKAAITEAVKRAVDAQMLPAPAQLPAQKMSIDPRRLTDIMADLRKIYARLDALGVLASDLPAKWWDQHAVHGIG